MLRIWPLAWAVVERHVHEECNIHVLRQLTAVPNRQEFVMSGRYLRQGKTFQPNLSSFSC